MLQRLAVLRPCWNGHENEDAAPPFSRQKFSHFTPLEGRREGLENGAEVTKGSHRKTADSGPRGVVHANRLSVQATTLAVCTRNPARFIPYYENVEWYENEQSDSGSRAIGQKLRRT